MSKRHSILQSPGLHVELCWVWSKNELESSLTCKSIMYGLPRYTLKFVNWCMHRLSAIVYEPSPLGKRLTHKCPRSSYIAGILKYCNSPNKVYADLEGFINAGGTSPQRANIVLHKDNQKEILIIEPTVSVPFETNTKDTKKQKHNRCSTIISDLECCGYKAILS